jgi:hypothetical protein
MIGMGMGGNQKVDPGDSQSLQVFNNPVSLVNFAGIDQDDLVLYEDGGCIPLPDVKKICPQVTAGTLLQREAGGAPGSCIKTAGSEETGDEKNQEACSDNRGYQRG